MNNSIDTTTISNAPPEQPGMDFNLLREEGIRHIQQLAGRIWTDHNAHDPGITMLEQLCYALTDLSYRTGYDIRDLLAEKDGDAYHSLYSPAEIMTMNPVTLLDFRKVMIDVPGVKNAWIEKVSQPDPELFLNRSDKTIRLTNPDEAAVPLIIKGLYHVVIEKKEDCGDDIQPDIRKKMLDSRNVCEDFASIRILLPQLIALSGNIELGEVEDINRFAAGMLVKLAGFISPSIRFYTLEEMLDKGKRIDEIVDGPLLKHGFIDDDELLASGRKTELHTSDLIRETMDVAGVIGVNNIRLKSAGETAEWRLVLDTSKTPKLDVEGSLDSLKFMKNGLQLNIRRDEVVKHYNRLISGGRVKVIPARDHDVVPEPGEYRSIETYYSIQNQFPENYGIGKSGLADSASSYRHAQASRLKGYLLFFDQLLANYFAQIAHLKDVFSFSNYEPSTYFNQSVFGSVSGAEDLLNFENAEAYQKWLNTHTESPEVALERKNRSLNHLLARFGESFTHYSLLVYSDKLTSEEKTPEERLIRDKLNFLQHYPAISAGRFKGFDYSQPPGETENRSGLEQRIAMKLGISNNVKAPIAGGNNEGFYMLEHILLRPVTEDFEAYNDFSASKKISRLEPMPENYLRITSPLHGLQNGERIVINGTRSGKKMRYDGTYVVEKVLNETFQVKVAADDSVKNEDIASGKLKAVWTRESVDTTIMILTQPITGFAKAGDKQTRCLAADHGLVDGEVIEISGTEKYDGKYAVSVDKDKKDAFIIDRVFAANEETGRWMSSDQKKDPFSLQLTFVFPAWTGRFQVTEENPNTNFRAFIEKTIREETPVHLTVYIRWLNKDEMKKFEDAYLLFLDRLRNN